MLTDQELDALEKNRQQDSDWVLNKIALIPKLQKYGEVHIAGAKALGLMVAKDIDISVTNNEVKVEDWQDLAKELMETPYVRKVTTIDYFNYNKNNEYDPKNGQKYSFYISLDKLIGSDKDSANFWEVQIHLQREEMFDQSKIDSIKGVLTVEKKLQILRIKYWADQINKLLKAKSDGNYKISSPAIYEAVLKKGIATQNDFLSYIEPAVPKVYKSLFV